MEIKQQIEINQIKIKFKVKLNRIKQLVRDRVTLNTLK